MNAPIDLSTQFQTPVSICSYMVSLLTPTVRYVLEPTIGRGNLAMALYDAGYNVTVPVDFFKLDRTRFSRFDAVVMNPPFSSKHAFSVPDGIQGMQIGYHILKECMTLADEVVALMPWFLISDSDVRLRHLKNWGMVSVTSLPRKTFNYSRIQTAIFHLRKGHQTETLFKVYDCL